MKTLAGIPTRLRNTSGQIADQLTEVCDEVMVVSQGATVNSKQSNVTIVEKDVNFGLVPARNYILQYAIDHDFDLVIECDDDIKFSSNVVRAMKVVLEENPTLGSISSASRAYFNWDKDTSCSQNFILAPCPAQLWGMRVKTVKEIGLMEIDYLEDREYGLRMWRKGLPVGMLHINLELTHNPFVARTTKTESDGGQASGMKRYEALGKAIEELKSRYPDLITLKQSPFGVKGRTFSTRYNWARMLSYVVARSGYALNYYDSKGRRL